MMITEDHGSVKGAGEANSLCRGVHLAVRVVRAPCQRKGVIGHKVEGFLPT